jgi:F-type H+-transporting ATPase subunit a
VGLVLVLLFAKFAQKIQGGRPPKGKFWNLLEVFLLFIRDQIARPTLGGHHEEDSVHPEHGHELGGPYAEHGRADHGKTVVELEREEAQHPASGEQAAAGAHDPHAGHGHQHSHVHMHPDMMNRFLPLLWTIFFFVLGCNLMGMVPWTGAPTAAFGVTLAMAGVTFLTVIVAGMMQFGVIGFFLNQIPGMDLPWYMAIIIKPMILAIELLGLCIKHGVLAVRLLANMVAGHLVILGIMGLAFGAEAAANFRGLPDWQWGLTATIAVVASAAFSLLELFVAFLQAYIITFLSALFIGAAIHKH